jgi:hypothetical protein
MAPDVGLVKIIQQANMPAPQILLYSQGDPIHISKQGPQWSLQGFPANDMSLSDIGFPIPNPGDAILQIRKNATPVGTYTWSEILQDDTLPISLPDKTHPFTIRIRDTTDAQTISLYPLYHSRTFRPAQTGIYIFRTFDKQCNETQNQGYHLRANQPATIYPSNEGFLGQCLRYLPPDFSMNSNLESNDIITFSGFHARERTRDASRPFARWTAQEKAAIEVVHPEDLELLIHMSFHANRPEQVPIDDVTVMINGKEYPIQMKERQVELHTKVLPDAQGFTTIFVQTATWNPATSVGSGDTRDLGIMLDSLKITFNQEP